MKEFKLDKHPKIETGFKTPEGYFENLYDTIDFQSKNENQVKVINFSSYRTKVLYAIAAVFVIAVSIPLVTNAFQTKESTTISTESIEDYLSYSQNISNQEVVELMSQEDINSFEIDLNIDKKEIESILTQSDDLEDYLLD